MEEEKEAVMVTPGEVLGRTSDVKAGRGAYAALHNDTVYASLTGFRRTLPPAPDSSDQYIICNLQRPTIEVTGHKAHGPVPQPGSVVIARVTKVMARTASADIMCVGSKSVREKFSGIISIYDSYFDDRQQDVRATEIDKVEMHLCFHPGDIVRAHVLSLGDARAYFLSTAKNELGVVSAESIAVCASMLYILCLGATMVPVSWTEMQCPLTGQIEQRKVAKAAS
uniref:3'-5' exoribonuclease CSL4 isogeny n=1 Tax=Cajanus cajan TaxID=3821 RepID=A0A151U5E7_CAJCA|nr:3'-5' exoribonuclease CSL4 isogeny [Cajanus cajan]